MDRIVADLYYYSDSDMERIIYEAIKNDKRRRKRTAERRRKEKIEEVKTWIIVFFMTCGFVIFIFLHWLIFGYGC